MPDPIPLRPRRDGTAADMRSLVQLGREEPPPVPAPVKSAPLPVDAADIATINAALFDAGITASAEDQAAVQALAKLDTATVEAVARWVKTEPKPDTN